VLAQARITLVLLVGLLACGSCGGALEDPVVDVAAACVGATASRTERIKVLTLNVRHDADQWQRRFELIADEIVRLDPDLIGLQEVQIPEGQHEVLNRLVQRRGHAPYEAVAQLKSGLEFLGGEGVAVMSRWPIVESARAALSRGRVSAFVRVAHPRGGTIDLLSTHFTPGSGDAEQIVKLGQARTTIAFANSRVACNPTFVTGDMNARDSSPALAAFFEAGFADSYRAIHGDAAEPAGNTVLVQLREGAFEQSPRSRVDFVLSQGAGSRTNTPVDSTVCFKNHDAKGFYPSDHFGVMTTFDVKL
jgi:endonuclease/exonuclease/phosphatase family metal-dependent hydrolase